MKNGTRARGHCNVTKRTVTTEYNSRGNLERYWFLVSKKHLKIRTFVNINVTTYLALVYNFIVTKGDKKRLACTVHKNFSINRYVIGL